MMFISGIGRTKFGALPESLPELLYEAMYNTIKDSYLDISDIGAIFVSNFLGGPLNGQLHLNSLVSSFLPDINIPILRIETACASSGSAIHQAVNSLQKYENVMIIGAEKMTSDNFMGPIESIAMASDRYTDQMNGLIFPASYALIAQQYLQKYGVNHEVLEFVSFINHQHANLNPLAHFYNKNFTLEKISNSPMVASPLNLFDCSPISDGGAGIILSKNNEEDRDVKILSSQLASDSISITHRKDLTSFEATKIAAEKAYKESKTDPSEIDIFEVHDCFTISELIALEDLGLCHPGEASLLIYDGHISRDGKQPVNTDGGLKANGHPIGATGLAQIFELVTQIRGEAGKRQINDVKNGLAQNIGGIGGTASITILGEV
jgi:acetyl-CoA C-acetyltransferase